MSITAYRFVIESVIPLDPAWKIARARQIAFKSSNDRAITTFDRSLLSRGRDSFFPFINEGGTGPRRIRNARTPIRVFSRAFFLFPSFFFKSCGDWRLIGIPVQGLASFFFFFFSFIPGLIVVDSDLLVARTVVAFYLCNRFFHYLYMCVYIFSFSSWFLFFKCNKIKLPFRVL